MVCDTPKDVTHEIKIGDKSKRALKRARKKARGRQSELPDDLEDVIGGIRYAERTDDAEEAAGAQGAARRR